jgi:hypothetical protein
MAALTDAMKWYNIGGAKEPRLKYFFLVEFYSSKYMTELGGASAPARLIFDSIRTVELPKFSVETEVANAWNVRQVIPTKINFEPVSITFNDTIDNRFQKFIKAYMNIISNSFQPLDKSLRTGFDSFGLNSLAANADAPLDKIVITRFHGDADSSRDSGVSDKLQNKSVVTLWRPKIVDVQHDTLDYSSSDAVTWQISVRYESLTYAEGDTPLPGPATQEAPEAAIPVEYIAEPERRRQWDWQTANLGANQGSDLPPGA